MLKNNLGGKSDSRLDDEELQSLITTSEAPLRRSEGTHRGLAPQFEFARTRSSTSSPSIEGEIARAKESSVDQHPNSKFERTRSSTHNLSIRRLPKGLHRSSTAESPEIERQEISCSTDSQISFGTCANRRKHCSSESYMKTCPISQGEISSEIEHCLTNMYLCGWILKKANGDQLTTVEKDNFVLDTDDIPNPPQIGTIS